MAERLKLAILDDYQGIAQSAADWSALQQRCDIQAFREHIADHEKLIKALEPFDILVPMRERTPLSRAVIERLPRLKFIGTFGMKNASIDLAAANQRGVVVCGTRTSPHGTAELTWALILGLSRALIDGERSMRAGGWQTGMAIELGGRTLGIIGLGRLGSKVAQVGKALGMEVIAWSPNLTAERAAAGGAAMVTKEELLRRADVVSLHVVLNERSRGLIGKTELALMKPTAYLINTSRGPLVDRQALLDALSAKRIGGAGLDVYDIEPLPVDDPLRKLPNVVLSPHMGFVTMENYRIGYGETVENIAAWLSGKPTRVIKPDSAAH
jgi:phosphoglycerate dehydrogenase-like enzyme